MARISIVGTTSNSISVRMTELDSGYDSNDRVCYWYITELSNSGGLWVQKGSSTLRPEIVSGGDYTITGLKPNTEYDIDVSIVATTWSINYTDNAILPVYAKTASSSGGGTTPSNGGLANASIVPVNVYADSFSVKITGMSSSYTMSRTCYWYIDGVYHSYTTLNAYSTDSGAVSFSGLVAGRTYTITASVSGGDITGTIEKTRSLGPTTIVVSLSSSTSNSLTVKLSNLSTSHDSANRIYFWRCGSGSWEPTNGLTLGAYVSESEVYSFTGLSANTSYTVWAQIRVPSGSSYFTVHVSNSFTTKKQSIALWSWSQSNGNNTSGVAENLTYKAYTALMNNGNLLNFDYRVWNDLVNKVSECCTISGSGWSSAYGLSYSAAVMSETVYSSDKVLTAARFNTLRYNILRNLTGVTTPKNMAQGEPVLGEYFVQLTSALNAWINAINA